MAMVSGCLTAAWRTRTAAVSVARTWSQHHCLSPSSLVYTTSVRTCTGRAWSPSRHQLLRPPQVASSCANLEVLNSRGMVNVAGELSSDVILPIIVRGKSTVAIRPLRDPERPKLPLTPWLRYLGHFRKAESAGLAPKEVLVAAAAKWKALPTAEKRRWEEPYAVEKKEYDKQMKAYVDSGKRDAWKRDPEKPKVPATGFLQFASEYRVKNKELKVTEATKAASSVWKTMSPMSKAPYEKKYVEAKAKYDVAMKQYKDSGKEAAWKSKVGITAAKEKLEAANIKKKEAAAKKKEAAAAKKKAAAAKKKAAAAKKKEAAAKKKEAAAKKKKEAAAKKKDAAAKKKEAAAAKKKTSLAKAKTAAAKKKEAADAEKKKAATAKEKAAAAKIKAEAKREAVAASKAKVDPPATKSAAASKKAPPPPPPR